MNIGTSNSEVILDRSANPRNIPVNKKCFLDGNLTNFQKQYTEIKNIIATKKSVNTNPAYAIIDGLKVYKNKAISPLFMPYNSVAHLST